MGGLKKLLVQDEVNHENARWRIAKNGFGAELILRTELKALREDMEVFYSHVSTGDVVGLRRALRMREEDPNCAEKASLIEAIIQMVEMDAEAERAAASVGGL